MDLMEFQMAVQHHDAASPDGRFEPGPLVLINLKKVCFINRLSEDVTEFVFAESLAVAVFNQWELTKLLRERNCQ